MRPLLRQARTHVERRLRLDFNSAPTMIPWIGEDGSLEEVTIDPKAPFVEGFIVGALAAYAKAHGHDANTAVAAQIVTRIKETRSEFETAEHSDSFALGQDWAANAEPDEIDSLREVDLSIETWQDFSDLGLDGLGEWITNHVEGGHVRYLDLSDPFHRGAIEGALAASETDLSPV